MRTTKKKYLLPLLVFLAGMGTLAAIVYGIYSIQQAQRREKANLNAMTYAQQMETDIYGGISVTDTLKQILVSDNGEIHKFQQVAENMMTDAIQSIQIAPDGVVTDIYPEKGNEAGKIDLIHDQDRGEICRYSRDNHVLTMQGPFQLKQGGYGIAVRNPVYLEQEDGQETFWGFTIVIIRVPEIFSRSVEALTRFGYHYRVLKTVSPWDDTYEEIYNSGGEIHDPVSYTFELGGVQWKLEVMPQTGGSGGYPLVAMGVGTLIVLLLTGLTGALLHLNQQRQRLEWYSITDGLTAIYNRHGFDDLTNQYIKQHPESHCVGVQFDIDDFKFINDIYGHAVGDEALRAVAASMREFFPKEAVFGRNGGDEFCIFWPDCTCEKAKPMLEQFTKMEKHFSFQGETHTLTLSVGYAEYPVHGKDLSQTMRCADAALYEVKMRWKNGCLAYEEGVHMENRTQLGFALGDISENLPGSFIIYKAGDDGDEILYANREMIRLAGCETMSELLDYTGRSFRNLIREDEQESVERSIWQQIGGGSTNDYVSFHLKKRDGSFQRVLDHGRIVENGRYGKVFYVMLADWKSMQEHYQIQ